MNTNVQLLSASSQLSTLSPPSAAATTDSSSSFIINCNVKHGYNVFKANLDCLNGEVCKRGCKLHHNFAEPMVECYFEFYVTKFPTASRSLKCCPNTLVSLASDDVHSDYLVYVLIIMLYSITKAQWSDMVMFDKAPKINKKRSQAQ